MGQSPSARHSSNTSVRSNRVKMILLALLSSALILTSFSIAFPQQGDLGSAGCSCQNPLEGTFQAWQGEPGFLCETDKFCYVECEGGCDDMKAPSSDSGLELRPELSCTSALACQVW